MKRVLVLAAFFLAIGCQTSTVVDYSYFNNDLRVEYNNGNIILFAPIVAPISYPNHIIVRSINEKGISGFAYEIRMIMSEGKSSSKIEYLGDGGIKIYISGISSIADGAPIYLKDNKGFHLLKENHK
jgi:hypothetical protein